jgi:4-amino-4-deoxy-L-arabinose transferase-like glycosyltransferase
VLPDTPTAAPSTFWTPPRAWLAVVVLLATQFALAQISQVGESPTVDEVAHLPAGITYWQQGTFRLYPHNPPLVKLAAALPVVMSGPKMDRIYTLPSWRSVPPIQASIAHEFAYDNAPRYFELFWRGRAVMPLFATIGGLAVFTWARSLYGAGGGLLALALWCLCPNVLAHARLVTSDVGATALGALATFVFWRYLKAPSSLRACLAGLALGLAVLAKFSSLLLVGAWPLIWLVDQLARGRADLFRRLMKSIAHAMIVTVVSVLVVNAGYLFEGTGKALGSFEFGSGALTTERPAASNPPVSSNELLNLVWRYRVNRFRGTWLGGLPAPLPSQFLIGFDLQKLDAEGVPARFVGPSAREGENLGYPVYLDGELRSRGWWYYYLFTLAYKVPEGTWLLGLAGVIVLMFSRVGRASGVDEVSVAVVPVLVMLAMSLGTDINLGLRYILPAFPYAFVAMGKLAPWAVGQAARARRAAIGFLALGLTLTAMATASIHPHYLAYFNQAIAGGPSRGSEHLIDSNLDWGQDLLHLRDWLKVNNPSGDPVGLAYFGQLNPNVLNLRGDGFAWFLAPPVPGGLRPMQSAGRLDGPPSRVEPGLYAVSASFVRGLPYSVYDGSMRVPNLYPGWDSRNTGSDRDAFGYFRLLEPIARVGHSIFVYRVSAEDAARIESARERPR